MQRKKFLISSENIVQTILNFKKKKQFQQKIFVKKNTYNEQSTKPANFDFNT